MTFGEYVKKERKERGWQRLAMARRLRISGPTLDSLEKGKTRYKAQEPKITVSLLFRIADIFNTTVSEIFQEVDSEVDSDE